jgi:hypothetical protein
MTPRSRFTLEPLRSIGPRQRRYLHPEEHRRHVEALKIDLAAGRRGAKPSGEGDARPKPSRDTLEDFFDDVVAIVREPDPCRDGLGDHLAEIGWPLRAPRRIRLLDGASLPTPPWWPGDGDAWVRCRSHMRVLEEALSSGITSLLVIEENVRLVRDVDVRIRSFLAGIPDSWLVLELTPHSYSYGCGYAVRAHGLAALYGRLLDPTGAGGRRPGTLEGSLAELRCAGRSHTPEWPIVAGSV